MKELSIEEKAKAYDEAIKRVENIKTGKCETTFMFTEGLFEHIFPSLKESEDERMIQYFKDLAPFDKADELYEKYGFSHKDAISWLEKQGGHAKFINGIQVGDKVTRNEDGVLVNLSQLKRIAKPAEEYNITGIRSKNAQGKLGEMIKKLKPVNEVLEHDSDWSEKYIADVFEEVGLAKIAREQGNENLSSALQSALIELGKFMPQQTSAWSEEDDRMIVHILGTYKALENMLDLATSQDINFRDNMNFERDWLSSLKERVQFQNRWKPSERQKEALLWCVVHLGGADKQTLGELLEELNKL